MNTPTPRTDDLAMLVARLARSLRKRDPGNTLPDQAIFYLKKHSLLSPLRDGDECEEDIQSLLSQVEELTVTLVQRDNDIAARDAELAKAREELAQKNAALEKINAIRNSIIGFATVNWSEHIYPLVAALNSAGCQGEGYPKSRENAGTLVEQIERAKAAGRADFPKNEREPR